MLDRFQFPKLLLTCYMSTPKLANIFLSEGCHSARRLEPPPLPHPGCLNPQSAAAEPALSAGAFGGGAAQGPSVPSLARFENALQ